MNTKSLLILLFSVLLFIGLINYSTPEPSTHSTTPFNLTSAAKACWPNKDLTGMEKASCVVLEKFPPIEKCSFTLNDARFSTEKEEVQGFEYGEAFTLACIEGSERVVKPVTNSYTEIVGGNFTQFFGAISDSSKAYAAFVLLTRPEHLSVALNAPEFIEATSSRLDPYLSDLEFAKINAACTVKLNNFEFYDYPVSKEVQGGFEVRRVVNEFNNEGSYYHETGKISPLGELLDYQSVEIFNCNA